MTTTYYDQDLSEIHDRDFDGIARNAAYFIKELTSPKQHPYVVDLGCGSGTTAHILKDAGHKVLGVDYSHAMIDLCRKRIPNAEFIRASLFDFDIPKCDMVTLIGEAICYLFDQKSDLTALGKLFKNIYNALPQGGLLLFDFLNPSVETTGPKASRFIENEHWSMYITLQKDLSEMVLTRDMVLFIKQDNELYRRSYESHQQRLYHEEQLNDVLQKIGFTTRLLSGYGDLSFRTGHKGFLCTKP